MFGFSSVRSLPSLVYNTIIKRTFKTNNKIRGMGCINQPPRIFKLGEEHIDRVPDAETRDWKDQRSLFKIDARGPLPKRKRACPIDGRPQLRGIVLRTLIKKPKKPNSANRKCVLVRLSNGREATCYVPGIGHNLQEHSNVLVRKHRTPDVPGLKLRVIRGVYDCSLVVKQSKV